MVFFYQKAHKIKRSHSTEHTKPHPKASITSMPSLPTRTRSSSRPTPLQDPRPSTSPVPDHKPPTSKLNAAPSTPKHSLRRVPVPSLSALDLDKLPYDRTRASPVLIPSSRSTSISGKSSIADIGGATSSRTKADQIKSSDNARVPTPPHPSPRQWETSSGSSQNQGAAYDPEKTVCAIPDLSILVSTSKQVATPMSSPRSGSQKPQRAVLRRKSSAKLQPVNQGLINKKSKPDFGISLITSTPQRAVASAHQPSHSVPKQVPLDAAHGVRRSTSDERKPRGPGNMSPSPRALTPAGAVVAAYKEQEKRKDLKDFVRANTDRDSCDENGGVYYTVFGSTEKVVAIGAPEEGGRSTHDLSNCIPNKPKAVSRKPSLGGFGKLTRKASTKAKKNGTNGFMSESECGHERIPREEVRRSSFQGRRSTSAPGKHRSKKSLGIAIEGSDVGLIWDSPRSGSTPSKSGGGSMDEPSPSAGGKIWKLMKRISTGGLRDKYQAQDTAPPVPALPEGLLPTPPRLKPKSKARSAPHSPEDSMPPTSRYIRGRSSFGDAMFADRNRGAQVSSGPLPSPRQPIPIPSNRKNPSHRRRSTNTRSSSPMSPDIHFSKYWQKSRSSSVSTTEEIPPVPERVLTSERILSPLELSKLEREQAAAEFSSPSPTVDSHSPTLSSSNHHGNTVIVIRKPSLQAVHVQASGEDSETDGMSTSEFAALPTPPRHHYKPNPHAVYQQSNGSGSNVGSVSTSPTIPMFSTQDAVNQFNYGKGSGVIMSRSSSTSQSPVMSSDEFGIVANVQPPPRPRRSDKRKPVVADLHAATRASSDRERCGRDGHHKQGVLPSTSASLPKEGTFGLSAGRPHDRDGRSYGTFGSSQSKGFVESAETSRNSGSSWEGLKLPSSVHSRSPLRFREMEGEEGEKDRKALTEKEKADRWDDLLEKSDRAGGTIHLGNSKLASDSLRFSDYSTLTTLAL
ncbi:hypothetical protein BJ322DRAFT_811898 [Thelephora terrestris]|uniref:Uncharacterized protein n=1 Tax=Thelephora terrestris TaxID=56493 RepID=A0A9P6HEA7_9AGAM|nr:hypothetical protein BJ322DRAFT_811898 [Thelephora terrestris]